MSDLDILSEVNISTSVLRRWKEIVMREVGILIQDGSITDVDVSTIPDEVAVEVGDGTLKLMVAVPCGSIIKEISMTINKHEWAWRH
jgi:hypothetical protein